jgi:hypothetical protein
MPSTLTWPSTRPSDPQYPASPITVEYSPEAIEKIRRLAFDALLSLPRVGLGVGGFLLGSTKKGRISILDFHPISCAHSSGPSFLPTDDEIAAAKFALGDRALAIVGFYCSRPRRELTFSDRDKSLFDRLSPDTARLALLIRPSATELSRAALFARTEPDGVTHVGELPLEPIETAPEPPAKPAPAPQPAPQPVAAPPAASTLVAPKLFDLPEPYTPPAFATAPAKRSLPWRTLAAAVLLAAALATAFATRDHWLPRPPLDLRTAETNGRFAVEWNRAAVRGIDNGLLTLTDGPTQLQIPLSASQLQAGILNYPRHSPQITAVLVAGGATASSKFTAPPIEVVPPPQPTPETSHP